MILSCLVFITLKSATLEKVVKVRMVGEATEYSSTRYTLDVRKELHRFPSADGSVDYSKLVVFKEQCQDLRRAPASAEIVGFVDSDRKVSTLVVECNNGERLYIKMRKVDIEKADIRMLENYIERECKQ